MPNYQPKMLYRSRKNRLIAGVAGGLGEYFGIDPLIVRVVFLLMSIGSGVGVILYAFGWFLIPEAGDSRAPGATQPLVSGPATRWFGITIIVVAAVFLGLFRGIWSLFLLLFGLLLLIRSRK